MSTPTWTQAKVIVRWDAAKVRERQPPVTGDVYEGAADFPGRSENSWSVLLRFDEPVDKATFVGRATMTLRAHWAPRDLLNKGDRCLIIENGPVAEAEVLEDSRQTDVSPLVPETPARAGQR